MRNAKIAFNPNIVVAGNDFFGRSVELDTLHKRVNHGQSVLITGERRIGKTSLLSKVYKSSIPPFDGTVKVWVETPLASISDLILDIVNALRERKIITSLPKRADYVLTSPKKALKILEKVSKDGTRITLFLNDLDDTLRSSKEEMILEFSSFLRSILDLGHAIACATSYKRLTNTSGAAERAPLFNIFNELPLGPFSEHEAFYFFSESSKRSGDCLLDSECSFFTGLLGLIPFHLQVAGFSLFVQEGFIDSLGDKRLEYMIYAVEESVSQLAPHWLYSLDSLTPNQRSLLGRIAKAQKIPDTTDILYLKQRGLISNEDDPFKSMGSLYRHFLLSAELDDSEDNYSRRIRYWAFTKDLAQAAVKTLIDSGIKLYLK